jgi:hypothetical protein
VGEIRSSIERCPSLSTWAQIGLLYGTTVPVVANLKRLKRLRFKHLAERLVECVIACSADDVEMAIVAALRLLLN